MYALMHVRNKTIIGLKCTHANLPFFLFNVRNKTIIGLKLQKSLKRRINFWLEIRL